MKISIYKSGIIEREVLGKNLIEYEIGIDKNEVITQLHNDWAWNEERSSLLSRSNEPEEHLDRIASIISNLKRNNILCFSYKDESLVDRLIAMNPARDLRIETLYRDRDNKYFSYPEMESEENLIERIMSKKNKYDLIIMRHYIEHYVEFDEICNQLRDKLTDEGIIYLEIPDCQNYIDKNNPLFLWEEHKKYYTKSGFINNINRVGFEVIISEKHGHGIEPCICVLAQKANKRYGEKYNNANREIVAKLAKAQEDFKHKWQKSFDKHGNSIMLLGITHNSDRFIQITGTGERITKLLDNDKHKIGKYLSSQKRLIENQWENIEKNGLYILGMNDRYHETIRRKLIEAGVSNYNIKYI